MRFDFCKSTDELKRIIAENPELPIVVIVDADAGDDYNMTIAPEVHYSVERILDNDEWMKDGERVICDEDELYEEIEDRYWDEIRSMTMDEQKRFIETKIKELEPCWKKVIAIYATT